MVTILFQSDIEHEEQQIFVKREKQTSMKEEDLQTYDVQAILKYSKPRDKPQPKPVANSSMIISNNSSRHIKQASTSDIIRLTARMFQEGNKQKIPAWTG